MYSLLERDPLVSPCLSEIAWQSPHMRATTKTACRARKLKRKQLTPRALLNHFRKAYQNVAMEQRDLSDFRGSIAPLILSLRQTL